MTEKEYADSLVKPVRQELANICRAFADLAITIEYRDRDSVLYKTALASAKAYAGRVTELLAQLKDPTDG